MFSSFVFLSVYTTFAGMEKKKVAQYIAQERLLEAGGKVIVALSGGADSVALLLLLTELGYACEAAHCNFHLRGEEADRDEQFVRRLCEERHVALHVVHFDTTQHAANRHISIEMAARELRYQWFETLRQELGADAVAVAHHADDSVETFLLNLMRGTGINGLRGIRPRNGHIVRPLLCLTRDDILHYLDRQGQPYVTDSTNLQDEYTRNKIRLNLLPLMQEINPSVRRSILRTAAHLDEAATLYNIGIAEARERVLCPEGICIAALLKEAEPQALLHEILHPLGFNEAQTDDIFRSLDGQAGKAFESEGWLVVKDRDLLLMQDKQTMNRPPRLEMTEVELTPDFIIPRDCLTACFDTSKLHHTLTLRLWQTGDTFVPFGMKGRKKVSDYLTDRKYSLLQKQRQWVLCCGEDIAWLVGERTDNRFRVDEHTRKVTLVRMVKE